MLEAAARIDSDNPGAGRPGVLATAYSLGPRDGFQCGQHQGRTILTRWIALLAVAFALGGCAGTPQLQQTTADAQWNGGIWNSVLGYVGPANAVVAGGPSGR